MAAVLVSGSATLTSSRDDVWPLLADTDRLNRWLGLPPVHAEPIGEGHAGSPARFVIDTRTAGISTRYEEYPFEWTHGREFRVFRRMIGGPLQSIRIAFRLAPAKEGDDEAGSTVTLELEVVPRTALVRPIAWVVARNVVSKLVKLAAEIDDHVMGRGPSPFASPSSPVDETALRRGVEQLKKDGTPARLADRIAELVGRMPDVDCAKIRPLELADAWSEEPLDVLRAFLGAVPAGLVELRWGIICPSCRTASQEVPSLEHVQTTGSCQLCDISFELDLDRAVEATFLPHPAVRRIAAQTFCIGGPARTPHVLSQVIVPIGEDRVLTAPDAPGRYRVFARGGATASADVTAGEPERAAVRLSATSAEPAVIHVAPGGELVVTNASDEPRHVKIERLDYATKAATAHLVSTLPDFRRLFSGQLLKRETPLKVSRVAVLFSDLTGSTALYSKVGDAAAFRLVDDHFDVLRAAVAAHQGTVVKTMGDAVLAAFTDPRQCARAAIEALRRFDAFRASREHGDLLGLKLGMHAGACYVVTANGALDYFGQTVNVASRIQHLAASGELLVSEDVYAELTDEDLASTRVTERLEARVKGVDEPLPLVRLTLSRPTVPPVPE